MLTGKGSIAHSVLYIYRHYRTQVWYLHLSQAVYSRVNKDPMATL